MTRGKKNGEEEEGRGEEGKEKEEEEEDRPTTNQGLTVYSKFQPGKYQS